MAWPVLLHDEFELEELPEEIQDELLARLRLPSEFGPQLGRPKCRYAQGFLRPEYEELKFPKNGLWRFAFAFDCIQRAIVLVERDKGVKIKPGLQGPHQGSRRAFQRPSAEGQTEAETTKIGDQHAHTQKCHW